MYKNVLYVSIIHLYLFKYKYILINQAIGLMFIINVRFHKLIFVMTLFLIS